MTPNDWTETESRLEERMQRADHPHGREMSGRSRAVVAWILGVLALGLVVYAILGWTGAIDVRGVMA